tara:strand:- start:196 stop:894 length:699 start_codon:yes stop_codon:yes gene_type:complete
VKKYIKKLPNNRPVIIHSDLLAFGKSLEKDKSKIVKIFIEHFKTGLFIPSFFFEKKKVVRFDKYENSMGSLTNICIKNRKFKRTFNPIHSYIYTNFNHNFDKYKNYSFGKNSLFNFFCEKDFYWINLGLNKNEGFTIFHHAEDLCDVPYRKRLMLKRKIYKFKMKQVNFNYFSRKKKIKYNFKHAIDEMIKVKILNEFVLPNTSKVYIGSCRKMIDFLVKKINENKKFLLHS